MALKRRTKRKSPSISKNHTDHEQDGQNIEGTLNDQRDVVSNQLHVDVQGMALKRRTKKKSRFKLQAELDMQPPSISKNHTVHEQDGQNIEGTLNDQRDVVSNQLHVDVQDGENIEGTLNDQRDVVSNQLHVDVQGNVPLVENMSSVPDQNNDMNQEYNEASDHNVKRKKRGPTFLKEIWG
ncbi:hypothetical protein ZIOFF_060382 [Zingiber officinale]|uniref:Uncharacterized protein n=1 Tax=Zingiber officinale TaxID=94328 RepID=A0A8J5FNV6_ZINOF|nr:hypothetical protein ZIOFF_060382 [Zingiber officinale]